MFGKGGGPLNAWIKEFCELVFIQTLQAFIFALVISFILNIMQNETTLSLDDRNTSLGIICIVALTSIFKIEDIARRIFGYGPTKADHGNAVQSIGKSMMALKMGKNLLDNGKKIVGGAGAAIGAHSQELKAQKRMQARLDALDKDNNGDGEDGRTKLSAGTTAGKTGSSDAGNEKQKLLAQAQEKRNESISKRRKAQEIRNSSPSKMSKKDREDAARKLENEALNIDLNARNLEDKANAIEVDYSTSGGGTSAGATSSSTASSNKSSGGRIKDYNQKKLQIQEEYDKQKKEIAKNKRQGIKTMVSGVAETGAALVGFTAGTAMSVASTNDWGGAVKDGISWAGTADAVTAGAVDLGFSAEKFVEDRVKNAGKLVGEYGSNVASAYKDYVKDIEKADKSISEETRSMMDDISRSAEKAAKDVSSKASATGGSKGSKKWTPSTRKGAATGALVKGLGKTAANHMTSIQDEVIKRKIEMLDKKNIPAKETDRGVFK